MKNNFFFVGPHSDIVKLGKESFVHLNADWRASSLIQQSNLERTRTQEFQMQHEAF